MTACSNVPVPFRVPDNPPSLRKDQTVILSTNAKGLKRGDNILFSDPREKNAIVLKRIVGLPGERFGIPNCTLLINGEPIEKPHADAANNNCGKCEVAEVMIPPDSLYVLGYSRKFSSDSRYWGTVSQSEIIGVYSSKNWCRRMEARTNIIDCASGPSTDKPTTVVLNLIHIAACVSGSF